MNYIKIDEAAAKWSLSIRRVQDLCKLGKVHGAKRFGTNWMIPADSPRPLDGRSRAGRDAKNDLSLHMPLIRKSPYLVMTDLYTSPGTADEVIESLSHHPEAQLLFRAEIAYARCDIELAQRCVYELLKKHSGFYAVISCGMQLGLISMWLGDAKMWREAKKHIYEAPWKDENDRDIIDLSIAATELAVRNTDNFPDWFYRGRFDHLPRDAHSSAQVYYTKYLMIHAQNIAAGRSEHEGLSSLALMRVHPFIVEPMIAQAVTEGKVMAEIYLRLLCSITYLQTGDEKNAAFHIDRAIEKCIPDGIFGPLVEHRRQLGLFLDERLLLISPEAARRVKELHKTFYEGWVALHNEVTENNISAKLSDREREVARLAAFGFSDAQIAEHLHITKSSVKSMIQMARNKTGVRSRSEFGAYV